MLLIGALALSLSNVASGQDRAIRIRNWDVLLTVNTDGSLDVTERLSIKFTGRWSRFHRTLSRRHTTVGGHPQLDIRQVSATDADGQRLRVETYLGRHRDSGGTVPLHVNVWITPYPMNEDRDVIIRYHVTNATRFDELYWNVNDVGYPIDQAHVVVVLPTGVEPARTVVYTRDSDRKYAIPGINPAAKVAADAKIETSDNTVGISLPRAFLPFEILTIEIGWPSGHITGPIKAPERPASMIRWWPLLIPLIVLVVTFTTWPRPRGRSTIRKAVLLIGALALSHATVASGQDGANRIRNLDAVLTVHSDGTLDVTEEIQPRTLVKRVVYDSLDAVARSRGRLRPR